MTESSGKITNLLIFTKSAPIWLYLSFVISARAGEWQGVRRVRLLFQHLLKERGAGEESWAEQRGLLLLNPWTFHTPAPYSDHFGSLFSLIPSFSPLFLSSKTQIKCLMDEWAEATPPPSIYSMPGCSEREEVCLYKPPKDLAVSPPCLTHTSTGDTLSSATQLSWTASIKLTDVGAYTKVWALNEKKL